MVFRTAQLSQQVAAGDYGTIRTLIRGHYHRLSCQRQCAQAASSKCDNFKGGPRKSVWTKDARKNELGEPLSAHHQDPGDGKLEKEVTASGMKYRGWLKTTPRCVLLVRRRKAGKETEKTKAEPIRER
jgi:hypothetical protein